MNKEIEKALNIIQNDFVNYKDAKELQEVYNFCKDALEQAYRKRLVVIKNKDYYANCYMQVIKDSYAKFVDKVVGEKDSSYAEHCFDHIEDIATYKQWCKSDYVKALKEMINRYGFDTDYEIVMHLNSYQMKYQKDNVIGYWVVKSYDDMQQAYENALSSVGNLEILYTLRELAKSEKEKKEYLPFCVDEEPPVVPVKKQFDKDDYASMYIDAIKMGYADIVNKTSLWGEAKNISDEDHSRLVRLWDKVKDISDYEDWIASEDVKQFHDITYGKYNLEDCELAMNYVDEINVGYWCYYYYSDLSVAIEQINDKIYPSHQNAKEFQEVKEIITNLIFDEKDLETEMERE